MPNPSERLSVATFTILNTQTDSNIVDLKAGVPVGIRADGWTAGNLTFKASLDTSTTPEELVDSAMATITITTFVANKVVQLSPDTMRGVRRLQLISQNAQGANRSIQVLLRRID